MIVLDTCLHSKWLTSIGLGWKCGVGGTDTDKQGVRMCRTGSKMPTRWGWQGSQRGARGRANSLSQKQECVFLLVDVLPVKSMSTKPSLNLAIFIR